MSFVGKRAAVSIRESETSTGDAIAVLVVEVTPVVVTREDRQSTGRAVVRDTAADRVGPLSAAMGMVGATATEIAKCTAATLGSRKVRKRLAAGATIRVCVLRQRDLGRRVAVLAAAGTAARRPPIANLSPRQPVPRVDSELHR